MSTRLLYVVDTFAVIAFFNREPGYPVIRSVFTERMNNQADVLMSEINWGELFYMVAKKASLPKAEQRLRHINRLGITLIPISRSLVKAAADLKITYSTSKNPISYADCFAAALAQREGATLVTGDADFAPLSGIIPILWVRANP